MTGLLVAASVIGALVAGAALGVAGGMHHGHRLSELGVEHDPAVGSQTSFRSTRRFHVN